MTDISIATRGRAHVAEAFPQGPPRPREAIEPLAALCACAQENGYALSLGDIISDGEEFCCNQMKSTNGGNPMPYDCFGFDDAYEMFFLSIL